MKIFLAGGTGAIGRELVPMLVEAGHDVTVLTRSAERAAAIGATGARAAVGDVFDPEGLAALVRAAAPELVMHQLTAFGATDTDPLAATIRVRTEGTRNLVAAALASGARRIVAQSISFICTPKGTGLTDEDTPLYLDAPPAIRPLAEAVSELERRVLEAAPASGLVLRYGWFYGDGTNYDPVSGSIPAAIRKGRMPVVGEGEGTYSFVHVRDAALATMRALESDATGILNIVDDEPARLRDWLPFVARLLGAPEPGRAETALVREKLGAMMAYVFTEQRGASSARARRVLGWQPSIPSWREGFATIYGAS